MMKNLRYFSLCLLLLIVSCSKEETSPIKPIHSPLTLSEFMNWVLDPAADGVWAAVGWISTSKGEKVIAPQTEEEWGTLRNHAATLMEASNLLMLDNYAKDNKEWMFYVNNLSKKAQITLQAIQKRDLDEIFITSSDIYTACEDCHKKYAKFEEKATTPNK